MSKLSRRDFLKLTAISSGAVAFSTLAPQHSFVNQGQKGIIIFVFDAMCAQNLSIHGYPRNTAPNLERFAARSTVYHAHNSAGNYTTPGTASLLTGTYPWTHRAINISGLIARNLAKKNLFSVFGDSFHRVAYSQNIGAARLLDQFDKAIDEWIDPEAFSIINQVIGSKLPQDRETAYRAFDDFLTLSDNETSASLILGTILNLLTRRKLAQYNSTDYPSGLPNANYPLYFQLKDIFDGIITQLKTPAPKPWLAYYHFWAPHSPYRPTAKFTNSFLDNWKPEPKPQHRFGLQVPNSRLNTRRQHYDEYIANVDDEFGRLLGAMEVEGILEDNYVVVTSDHGEMFERGTDGHITPLLYDPVVHSPLIISSPGQTSQVDITTPTNSVDILPTLLSLTGQKVPDWCEGKQLPGLGGRDDPQRATFVVEAKQNPAFAPIRKATIAMRKGQYKLIYYTGYESDDSFELYDHGDDVEEMNDLYPQQPTIARTMREELLDHLSTANHNFSR